MEVSPRNCWKRCSLHATWFTCLLLFLSFTGFSATPVVAQDDVSLVSVNAVLVEGAKLENNQQWAEALNLYQRAVRKYPKDTGLQTRRSVARIHYDLGRRYADRSFIKTIRTTDGEKAGAVYAEVLLKIQSYYVDEPNWAELASYGLTSLEVALLSPDFRRQNLPNISLEQVRSTILQTRKSLESARVNQRNDAHQVAMQTAIRLEKSIGLSRQATIYEFVCGAISALDPYSAFMSSNQYSETMSQIEGNFVGLGVELKTHPDHLEIVNVIRGGSANLGGIIAGDRITAVDQQSVMQYGGDRVADLMRGPEGSYVQVTLDRGKGPQVVQLERRRVEIPSVDEVGIIDSHTGVGYIKLTNFQKTTARDFDNALWQLSREGMRSLIVDVRGNPGGLLSASVEVADRFVQTGVIVSTKGRNPMEDYIHKANVANTWRMPLVVLIDDDSASASEIFAAAIRDHGRGVIVGEQSYGKGSVQGIFPLNASGGGVRLTTAKFYSPKGKPISQVGVAADVQVQHVAKPAGAAAAVPAEDLTLKKGIQIARRSMEARNAQLQSSRRKTPTQAVAGR